MRVGAKEDQETGRQTHRQFGCVPPGWRVVPPAAAPGGQPVAGRSGRRLGVRPGRQLPVARWQRAGVSRNGHQPQLALSPPPRSPGRPGPPATADRRSLVAGSRARLGHWGHLEPRSRLDPPGFTRLADQHRVPVPDAQPGAGMCLPQMQYNGIDAVGEGHSGLLAPMEKQTTEKGSRSCPRVHHSPLRAGIRITQPLASNNRWICSLAGHQTSAVALAVPLTVHRSARQASPSHRCGDSFQMEQHGEIAGPGLAPVAFSTAGQQCWAGKCPTVLPGSHTDVADTASKV